MFKKIHQSIPKKRLFFYLLALGTLPVVLALSHWFFQTQKMTALHKHLEAVRYLSIVKEKKESTNTTLRNHYQHADHYYIDKHLEGLPLLQKELAGLQKITKSESYTGNTHIEKRLQFLNSENKLRFHEGSRTSGENIEEVVEILDQPIEIDGEDLLTILSRIEEKNIGGNRLFSQAPQMIITDFSLQKKQLADSTNETLLLNIKLLKREFL